MISTALDVAAAIGAAALPARLRSVRSSTFYTTKREKKNRTEESMEIIQGRKTLLVDSAVLTDRLRGYKQLWVDIGTGDGRFVQGVAKSQPHNSLYRCWRCGSYAPLVTMNHCADKYSHRPT